MQSKVAERLKEYLKDSADSACRVALGSLDPGRLNPDARSEAREAGVAAASELATIEQIYEQCFDEEFSWGIQS